MESKKTLVVFYSRTGTTKNVAEAIAQSLQSDTEEIVTTKNRTGFFGLMSSGFQASFKKLTGINEIKKNPAQYDIVIIGTPVWVGTMSSPIRTYISQNKESIKDVAFFCTCGNAGSKALQDMESMCEKKPLVLLELKMDEVKENRYKEKVQKFVDGLKR